MSGPDYDDLKWLEEERQAEIYDADGVDYPIAEFQTSSGRVRVCFESRKTGGQSTSHYTGVVADLPDGHFWARLEPGGCLSSWSSNFNTRYSLDTNSRSLAADWLTGEVRNAILACDPTFVEIMGCVLVLQFSGHAYEPDELGPMLECCDIVRRSARDVKLEDRRELLGDLEHLGAPHHASIEDDEPGAFPRLLIPSDQGEAILECQTFQELRSWGLPAVLSNEFLRSPVTIFAARVENAANLKISPQKFWHAIPKFFGWKDLQIGDPEFDGQFVVKSNSDAFARTFLTEACRRRVRDLFAMPGGRLVFDISGGILQIVKHEYLPIGYGSELASFLTSCMGILSAIGVDVRAIEVVEVVRSDEAVCRVCLAPLVDRLTACVKCRTIHHQECWDYMGCCSTFGCGSMRAEPC